jgi:DNA-directed RNA polymerase specialized sigma24 family protein
MRIPSNMTEEEVIETIYRVVDTLSSKFRFGYHSIEDMRQEGTKFAIQALNKGLYDETRPLDNFLYVHMRNRFINYKRDTYARNEPPCKTCVFYDPKLKKSKEGCAAFDYKEECKKLNDWKLKNEARKSLMKPGPAFDENWDSVSNQIENSNISESLETDFTELRDKIRAELPLDITTDYLRMLEGVSIPKARREKVKEAILNLNIKHRFFEEDHE